MVKTLLEHPEKSPKRLEKGDIRVKEKSKSLTWDLTDLTARLRAGDGHAPSALYNTLFSTRDSFATYWDSLAEFLDVAFPLVDFSKPIYIRPGIAKEFGTKENFYAEMIEPWAGPLDHLRDRLKRFKGGYISQEEGQSETSAAAKDRRLAAAENTDGLVLPRGQPKHELQIGEGCTYEEIGDSSISTQLERARRHGISTWTQKKLDRLAREFPDLLEEVREGKRTVNGAALLAGIVKPKNPYKQLCYWLEKASAEEKNKFEDFIARFRKSEHD